MKNKNIKLKLDFIHEKQYKNIEYIESNIFNNNQENELNKMLKDYIWIYTYFDGYLNCKENEQILTQVKLNNSDCLILGENIPNKLFLSAIHVYKNTRDYYFPDGFYTLEEILNNC